MPSLYGDSIFESTDNLNSFIEAFNNDLLLFDGLLNESVLNESIKEKAKELGNKLSTIIDKVINKINEIRSKIKVDITLAKWKHALSKAAYPVTVKYIDADKILDFAEDIGWHVDNIATLSDKSNITKNEVEVERDNLDNIYKDYEIKTDRDEVNIFIKKDDISNKEDAKKFIDGDLKHNIQKGDKISIALNKLIISLKKVKEKIGKMIDKADKDIEVGKSEIYNKLYGYSISTISLMKKVIELCNFSLTPHIIDQNVE